MLEQTMKIYDAQDNLILTKTRTVENEEVEISFQAKVEIEEDV